MYFCKANKRISIQKSWPMFLLCLMLSSIANSQSASPISQPIPVQFPCLSRDQKEAIEVEFEQNESCHAELAKLSAMEPEPSFWKTTGLYIILGLAVGFAAGAAVR